MELKNKSEMNLKFENKRIKEKNDKLIIIPVHKIYNYNILDKNLNLKRDKVNKILKLETNL